MTIQLDWVKEIGSRLHNRVNQVCFDFKEVSLYSDQLAEWGSWAFLTEH